MTVSHILTDLDFSFDFEVRQEAFDELKARIEEGSIDIRNALSSFEAKADSFQKKVIEASENTIRLVAPAGSGKSQTVINRVVSRVRQGLNPNRILVVTFDNAAAASLTNHLKGIGVTLPGLRISTLNAFGYWLLKEYFRREFKPVVPDYRSHRLFFEVKEALKEKSTERFAALPKNLKNSFFLDFFGLLKNELFDPRSFDPQKFADFLMKSRQVEIFFIGGTDKEIIGKIIQALAWLFGAYEKVMQRENFVDFNDQKLRPFLTLRDDAGLLRIIQNSYSEIIVDEFQDINRLDFEFIKLIAVSSCLVVTGDDDQAIYGFRGCTPDFIIDFEKHLRRQVAPYELQINYRCPANIVEHADRLIRHNVRRIEKHPIAFNKSLSDIKVISTLSAGLEAKSIVSLINRIKKSRPGLKYNDFAILYRTNAQSLPLQVEFVLNGLPFYVREQDNILSNELLDKLLGVLRLKLAVNQGYRPNSHDAVLTVRAYFRYVNSSSVNKLERLLREEADFLEAISSQTFWNILSKAEKSHLVTAVQEILEAKSLMVCLDILSKRFRGLEGMIGSLEDVIEEKVPLGEIYEIAANFGGSISDFLSMMERALHLARTTNAGKDEEGGIKLLTYFRSKGLQWHTVILTTCNDGLIPHVKAPVEDERRLFYVAMTRASSNLVLSYVKNSCGTKVNPSRFLYEAGLLRR